MGATRDTMDGVPVSRHRLLPVLQGVAVLFAGLVLVQAILAGRGWFVDLDLIEIHGYLGNAVFLIAILQVALAVGVGLRGPRLAASAVIVILVFAQVGLGYAGRESAVSAAWHIPNGVLIFGLAAVNCTMLFDQRRPSV
jgi:hypothetical protein